LVFNTRWQEAQVTFGEKDNKTNQGQASKLGCPAICAEKKRRGKTWREGDISAGLTPHEALKHNGTRNQVGPRA